MTTTTKPTRTVRPVKTTAAVATSTAFLTKPPGKSMPKKRAPQEPDAHREFAKAMEIPGPSSRLSPEVKLAHELQSIQTQITDLVDQADRLVRTRAPREYARAQAYWIAQLRMALDGNSMYNMSETIKSLTDGQR